MLLYLFAALLYVLSTIPQWFWASTIITIVHTLDESYGEIWDFLSVPILGYFGFQTFVLWLGWSAIARSELVWLFLLIRIGDVLYTHIYRQAPGWATAILLVGDAIVVGTLL